MQKIRSPLAQNPDPQRALVIREQVRRYSFDWVSYLPGIFAFPVSVSTVYPTSSYTSSFRTRGDIMSLSTVTCSYVFWWIMFRSETYDLCNGLDVKHSVTQVCVDYEKCFRITTEPMIHTYASNSSTLAYFSDILHQSSSRSLRSSADTRLLKLPIYKI